MNGRPISTDKSKSNSEQIFGEIIDGDQLRRLLATLTLLHTANSPDVTSDDDFRTLEPLLGGSSQYIDGAQNSKSIGALGEFTIIRELGRGGMGIVYEATQLSLDRRVALKILPFASMLDDRRLKRFTSEARAAAMLKHPGIVSVYSIGCSHGVHYYAMELIEGQSLVVLTHCRQALVSPDVAVNHRTHGDADTAYPAYQVSNAAASADVDTQTVAALTTSFENDRKSFHRSIARLGIQAADALDYAHQEGVVHRDIKPSNLLIDHHGKLYITDFGLARVHASEDLTMTGDLVGTLRYMSPEQIEGGQLVDQRTDIYSLGLTLYELLAQRPAFIAETQAELINEINQREPKDLASLDRSIPKDLATIVNKSIAKNPHERYRSARDLGDDLTRFLENKPVRARRSTVVQKTWRWCKRNRSTAALIGLTSLILLTSGIVGPIIAIRQSDRARAQSELAEHRRVELYESDMAKAYRHVEVGEIDQAVKILRSHLPHGGERDLRHFEWYELLARCRRRLEAVTVDLKWPCWSAAWSKSGDLAMAPFFEGPVVVDEKGCTGSDPVFCFEAKVRHVRWRD